MKYTNIKTATFLKRPNRFIAHVLIDSQEEIVHVKNTGRCKEILKEGTTVILEEGTNPNRKTKYSLIAAYKEDVLINIDSQVPNTVIYEAIMEEKIEGILGITSLRREVFYDKSRFDLYFETNHQKGFIEVKGVTLEKEQIAMFPDAPTERGCKHVLEMIKAVEEGYKGYICFLIQMKGIKHFTPNTVQDPDFAEALQLASKKGVQIIAYDAKVLEDEITIGHPIKIVL